MQMYEAAHRLVKLVIKRNFTNERDNLQQVMFRLLIREGYYDIVNGTPVAWVGHRWCKCACV
jgi:hypothetical protein